MYERPSENFFHFKWNILSQNRLSPSPMRIAGWNAVLRLISSACCDFSQLWHLWGSIVCFLRVAPFKESPLYSFTRRHLIKSSVVDQPDWIYLPPKTPIHSIQNGEKQKPRQCCQTSAFQKKTRNWRISTTRLWKTFRFLAFSFISCAAIIAFLSVLFFVSWFGFSFCNFLSCFPLEVSFQFLFRRSVCRPPIHRAFKANEISFSFFLYCAWFLAFLSFVELC